MIENACVDECNEDLKIIVEFNGDFWHCNPETWTEDRYNKAIKMTAGEKWRADFKRNMFLKNRGFLVIVVWESEWKKNREKVLNRIVNAVKNRQYET